MRFNELDQTLASNAREYGLSPHTAVALQFDIPGVLDTDQRARVRYQFFGGTGRRWLNYDDLTPAELVKLADIVGMVNKWKAGEITDLMPSTSTMAADIRAALRARGED